MSVSDIIISYVVPCVGMVLTLAMFTSPVSTMREVHKIQALGDMNPLPFVMMSFNCIAWITYGTYTPFPVNMYCLIPNLVGLCCGIYCTLVAFPLSTLEKRNQMANIIITIAAGLSLSFFLVGYYLPHDTAQTIVGSIAVFILMCYFSAPLSEIRTVIITHDARSIFLPSTICAGISSSLWGVFGIVVGDFFIGVPNCAGMILSLVQILLKVIFRNTKRRSSCSVGEQLEIINKL